MKKFFFVVKLKPLEVGENNEQAGVLVARERRQHCRWWLLIMVGPKDIRHFLGQPAIPADSVLGFGFRVSGESKSE